MKVPPRIVHVFTKCDLMQEEARVAALNEQIVNALEREGHIDLKAYVSCLPIVDLKRKSKAERDPDYTGEPNGDTEWKPRYVVAGMSEFK